MSDILAGDTVDRALAYEVAAWAESRLEDPSSLAGLSELEADVLGTITAVGVIGNGGLAYWYEGKGRAETLAVAESFDRMGMAAAADAMRQSLSAFPGGAPPEDLGDRQAHVWSHGRELEATFGPLDEAIWDCGYDQLAARHVFRRRRELLALEPGFGPLLQRFEAADRRRTARLLWAASALDAARSACERAVEAGDLTGALDQAMSADADAADFWGALAEVARALGHRARAARCEGWERIARKGALHVAVAFVPERELSDGNRRYGDGDEVRWNAGAEPAGLFRARRSELFFADRGWAHPGHEVDVYLVPGDQRTKAGTAIVLHQGGEIIGRGHVLGRRGPGPA